MSLNKGFIPEHTKVALKRFVEDGTPPGDFLRACLENRLTDAFACADAENKEALEAICHHLVWEVPSVLWGSRDKVDSWIAK